MHFTEFFIRRPAFTLVITLVMTMVGLIGYASLPVRWIPNVTPPVVSINTNYTGASASLVESQITTPIEAVLSGIEGVDSITSSSRQGESNITLNFKLGRNMDAAVEDVRSSLANVTGNLPKDVLPPIVSKAQVADTPILFLAFLDAKRSGKEVTDYVDQFVIPRLQTVDGVATVVSFGRRASALRIWLDPNKMASSSVTVDDISTALTQQNIQVPSGTIRGMDRFYNVVTNETMTSATQFNDLILREDQNQIIRLKNVGEAIIAPLNLDTAFRVEGEPAVAVGIIPQSTANPLDVSNNVMKAVAEMKKALPPGMRGNVVYNIADFIHSSVNSVYEAVFESVLFVLLVIYLFLANWRATLIPIITIPVCLIATFALMHLFKFSINTITLMAFVLAIGLVVDDAIVMLENISRYIESGMSPFKAALIGSREMIFPIIAMTLTLAAVYTPIAFTSGILGAVFSEFAVTLSGAVIVSGIVALTLTPMMCSRLLRAETSQGRYGLWFAARFLALRSGYRSLLSSLLIKRLRVIAVLCLVGCLAVSLYHHLPSELAPLEDRNEVDVYVSAPNDASFQYTDAYVKKMEAIYSKISEVTSYLAGIGMRSPASSFQMLNLKPWYKRFRSAQKIVADINSKTDQFAGVNIYASLPPPPIAWFSESGGNNVEMAVMTSGEYKDLYAVMQKLITAAKKSPVFAQVDNQLKWDRSQFEVAIDREKAADLRVPMSNITGTISTLLAGRTAGKFEFDGKQYDIIMQMHQSLLASPNILSQLYVRGDSNHGMVSLADLLTVRETTSPGSLPHFERLRSDSLVASLAPGFTMADAVVVLNKVAHDVLPENMKMTYVGEAKNYLEANAKVLMTFLLALVFIYLVLVAQFESFIDPFIILLTVPFAMFGALLLLKVAGGSLNLYSEIGLVTLIGLIAKHGILMTEFANRKRLNGSNVHEAILEAAMLRLRPILMTTSAMTLGALPLALAIGAGAETRHQIGWVIVGGLIIGTFFSLIVVPVAYTYLAPWKKLTQAEEDDLVPVLSKQET